MNKARNAAMATRETRYIVRLAPMVLPPFQRVATAQLQRSLLRPAAPGDEYWYE